VESSSPFCLFDEGLGAYRVDGLSAELYEDEYNELDYESTDTLEGPRRQAVRTLSPLFGGRTDRLEPGSSRDVTLFIVSSSQPSSAKS
jgi:hypothetical protein